MKLPPAVKIQESLLFRLIKPFSKQKVIITTPTLTHKSPPPFVSAELSSDYILVSLAAATLNKKSSLTVKILGIWW